MTCENDTPPPELEPDASWTTTRPTIHAPPPVSSVVPLQPRAVEPR